jgi:hypothetical protein
VALETPADRATSLMLTMKFLITFTAMRSHWPYQTICALAKSALQSLYTFAEKYPGCYAKDCLWKKCALLSASSMN